MFLAQWEWGLPVPHIPQELGTPEQVGPSPPELAPATEAAKVERILVRRVEPQAGHGVPSHWRERTRISFS